MTKSEIVNRLIQQTGIGHQDAERAVEVFLDSVKNALHDGDKVSLVGFGTFFSKDKPAREGRNPRTGERIHIPPKRVAMFKPGKAFRELVNDGTETPGD